MSNYPNFIASMYISIIAMPLANASDIQIKTAHSVGQGVLYQSNGDCYAITPAHVMDGTSNAMALTANRQVHNVTLEHEFSNDIALLRVESPGVCGENVKPLNSLSKVLTVVKNGELLTKLDDASTLSTPIEVTSYNDEFLQIKASDDGRPFKQGFSGSVLFIANSISGLLLEVEDGFGYVYRYDALKEELDEYFEVGIVTDTLSVALISEVLGAPLTKGEVKDFNLTLSTNNPIEFISQPLDSNLEYRLEIFDSNDKRHFSEMYWAKNKYRYAFNPPESGIYTLRFTGKSNHGDFRLETK
ncbi:TPA: hypothetical protein I7754_13370, partial [Vibrio vulnificus]|nr:hypothetical protein [Vibrio vulnificus]